MILSKRPPPAADTRSAVTTSGTNPYRHDADPRLYLDVFLCYPISTCLVLAKVVNFVEGWECRVAGHPSEQSRS